MNHKNQFRLKRKVKLKKYVNLNTHNYVILKKLEICLKFLPQEVQNVFLHKDGVQLPIAMVTGERNFGRDKLDRNVMRIFYPTLAFLQNTHAITLTSLQLFFLLLHLQITLLSAITFILYHFSNVGDLETESVLIFKKR